MLVKSPNATDKRVGARVRMRRLILGMSQAKTSARLRHICSLPFGSLQAFF